MIGQGSPNLRHLASCTLERLKPIETVKPLEKKRHFCWTASNFQSLYLAQRQWEERRVGHRWPYKLPKWSPLDIASLYCSCQCSCIYIIYIRLACLPQPGHSYDLLLSNAWYQLWDVHLPGSVLASKAFDQVLPRTWCGASSGNYQKHNLTADHDARQYYSWFKWISIIIKYIS